MMLLPTIHMQYNQGQELQLQNECSHFSTAVWTALQFFIQELVAQSNAIFGRNPVTILTVSYWDIVILRNKWLILECIG